MKLKTLILSVAFVFCSWNAKAGIKELTVRQLAILECIILDKSITTASLKQKIGVSQRTLMRDLSRLQELGAFSREGGRKDGRWVVAEDFADRYSNH